MEGGHGVHGITQFYGTDFIPCNPPDMQTLSVSRTVGDRQIVDELIVSFTHTQEVPWMLPGVPPTGKFVRVPLVAIVGFAEGKVSSEHIYWDNASVLFQVGLIQPSAEIKRCVNGAVTADCVLHTVNPVTSRDDPL
jgi:carboxymethylenebutenolidase